MSSYHGSLVLPILCVISMGYLYWMAKRAKRQVAVQIEETVNRLVEEEDPLPPYKEVDEELIPLPSYETDISIAIPPPVHHREP